jgi:hypothetical protein
LPLPHLSDVGGGQGTTDDLHEDDKDVEEAEDEQLRLELALVHRLQDPQAALSSFLSQKFIEWFRIIDFGTARRVLPSDSLICKFVT